MSRRARQGDSNRPNRSSGLEPALSRRSELPHIPTLGGKAAMFHALESLRDKNPRIRSRAAEQLARFGDEQVIAMLGEALTDPSEVVRTRAAEALGKIGGEQAYRTLIQVFEGADGQARRSALFGLGYYSDPHIIKRLTVLLGHVDWGIREGAADSLVRIGEAAALWLIEVLNNGLDTIIDEQSELSRLREQLRMAYSSRYKNADWVPYENEDDIRTRSILRVLGQIGGASDDVDERNRYSALIASYLNNARYSARAFEAIADVAAPDTLDLLADLVRGEHTERAIQAARALGRLGKIAIPFMLYIVFNGTRSEVATIRYAFATLPKGARISLPNYLLPYGKRERCQVAKVLAAVNRIGRLEPLDFAPVYERRILRVAIDLTGSPDFAYQASNISDLTDIWRYRYDYIPVLTRCWVVRKLGKIWPYTHESKVRDSVENTLGRIALDDEITCRRAAIRALTLPPWPEWTGVHQRITRGNTRQVLVGALQDNDMIVRGNTILALGSRGVDEIVPRLIQILKGSERELHHAAAQALGRMKRSDEATLALIDAAGSSYTLTTRRHAVRALGRWNAQNAIPLFLSTLDDPSRPLRKEAAKALRKTAYSIGKADADAVDALRGALGHPSAFVRYHAARALALAGDAAGAGTLLGGLHALAIPCLTHEEIAEALEKLT